MSVEQLRDQRKRLQQAEADAAEAKRLDEEERAKAQQEENGAAEEDEEEEEEGGRRWVISYSATASEDEECLQSARARFRSQGVLRDVKLVQRTTRISP